MIVGLLPGRAARADSPKLAASWQSRAGAPGLAAGSIAIALRAYRRAQEQKLVRRERLTIVDYSLPSTEPRLWVLDPESGKVLFAERVAHGRGSGDLLATRFGNRPESHRSSLGVFRTAETYTGAHGYSLRLDGLEKGINDRAREREIVFHSADYATEAFGREHGYLGRSYGCLALAPAVSHALIDEIRGGSIVVALGNEQRGEVGSR
jgi:hypothetical protein